MEHRKLTATALVTRNSLSYLNSVFALNQARQPLVNVADEAAAKALTGIAIDRCIVPEEGGGWFGAEHALIHDDRPAQITFTSGTEGKPKGIVLSYSNLADAAERIIDQMQLTDEVREYVGVPVTYSFGIGRIRAVSAVGGRCYLPSRGFDPMELARMLKAGEVNALSAVPTLLRIVLRNPGTIGEAGKALRWLEIGSQYMSGAEKRAVRALFPNARIVQHYGLTEASRTTFLVISEVEDNLLDTVGKPVGKTEIGLSEDGLIRIRGPHVARWRLAGDDLVELVDAEGWLQTSDLGHMESGFLHYDGRADDVINVGGVKVNPDLLEAQIGKILGRAGGKIVAAKVPDALRGEGVLVVSEGSDIAPEALQAAATEALKALGLYAGDALHIKVVAEIPRTATGKPMRRRLTEDFLQSAQGAAAASAPEPAAPARAGGVMEFFEAFFPGRTIGRDDSFETLGGDSLSYIQFSLGFEDRFGQLPSGWEAMSVTALEPVAGAEKEKAAANKGGIVWRRLDAATLTRAFFMICIVALHLDTFVYSSNWGAAYFLFMLCGYSAMRFQWPEISRTGNVSTLFGTIVRIAIPTFLVVVTMQVLARTFELKPLTLFSNWFDSKEYHIAYYYFAEIYMQLLLVLAGLLCIPKVREWLKSQPMVTCTAFLVAAIVLSWAVDQVWDTNYLYHRTPIWYLWTVAAGMLMASARDRKSRIAAMVIVTAAVILHHGMTSATAYIVGGSALLLFWPEITVPAPVKTIVGEIAGASMFMYLSHFQVKSLVIKLFHGPMPWLALFGAIGFGILAAHVYSWVESRFWALWRARFSRAGDGRAAGGVVS